MWQFVDPEQATARDGHPVPGLELEGFVPRFRLRRGMKQPPSLAGPSVRGRGGGTGQSRSDRTAAPDIGQATGCVETGNLPTPSGATH
jgi:hypothetical protein